MPRPSKLTKSIGNQILSQVRQGLPLELAAEAHHVARSTALEWVRRGEGRGDRPATPLYTEFATDYRAARASYAHLLTQTCLVAITGLRKSRKTGNLIRAGAAAASTRASHAQWHLARRFPEFWGGGREMLVEDSEAKADERGGGMAIRVFLGSPDDDEPKELALPWDGSEVDDG